MRQQKQLAPHEIKNYRDRMGALRENYHQREGPGLMAAQTVFLGAIGIAMTMAVAGAVMQQMSFPYTAS